MERPVFNLADGDDSDAFAHLVHLAQQGTQTFLPGDVLVAQLMVLVLQLVVLLFSSSSSIFSREMLSTADCTLIRVAQGLLVTYAYLYVQLRCPTEGDSSA